MTWWLAPVSCIIPGMFWDKHHQPSFLSKNYLFICLKHVIYTLVHHNVCLHTNPTSDQLIANLWTVGILRNLQISTVRLVLSRTFKLAIASSIWTWSWLYLGHDFSVCFLIIILICSTTSHCSMSTTACWERIWLERTNWYCIQQATQRETAATRTPENSQRSGQHSHGMFDSDGTDITCLYNWKQQE